ncbi:IS6 family transposase [Streptomyces sp. LBUM 1478]|nr:IS6 family transposase [Streptomyces sp. LBUM 1478]
MQQFHLIRPGLAVPLAVGVADGEVVHTPDHRAGARVNHRQIEREDPHALNRMTYHLPSAPFSPHHFGVAHALAAGRIPDADVSVSQDAHGTRSSLSFAAATASRARQLASVSSALACGSGAVNSSGTSSSSPGVSDTVVGCSSSRASGVGNEISSSNSSENSSRSSGAGTESPATGAASTAACTETSAPAQDRRKPAPCRDNCSAAQALQLLTPAVFSISKCPPVCRSEQRGDTPFLACPRRFEAIKAQRTDNDSSISRAIPVPPPRRHRLRLHSADCSPDSAGLRRSRAIPRLPLWPHGAISPSALSGQPARRTSPGQIRYPWRAVDQDGTVLDIFAQNRRNKAAARRFFRRLLKKTGAVPRVIVTDKLRSYSATHREAMPSTEHRSHKGLNNRAENSHQPTRQREHTMKASAPSAQRSGSCPHSVASHPTSGPAATPLTAVHRG